METELLRRHRVLDTSSEAELAAFQTLHGGAHLRRIETGRGPLRYICNVARLAEAELAYSQASAPATRVSVPEGTRWFLLHASLSGETTYRLRGRAIRVVAGQGLLLSPRVPYSLERAAGEARLLVLRLPAGALRPGLASKRRGVSLSETPSDLGSFASLRRTLLFAASELDEPSSSLCTSVAAQRDMLALLTAQLLAAFESRERSWPIGAPERLSGAERLSRVADWIEGNLHGPITLAQLAEVAGIGGRSLQQEFQRAHGCSPFAFLRERRLARAHALLSRASSEAKVTEVAERCGFAHLGRFSTAYRRAFGESPSATLTRARSR